MEDKLCACKGIRKCLLCDAGDGEEVPPLATFIYCDRCGDKAFLESNYPGHLENHDEISNLDQFVTIKGVSVRNEVISKDEELTLVESMDCHPWIDSQSGRRKQDFGPKINFKRKKINFTNFTGLPCYDMQLFDGIRLSEPVKEVLDGFEPVEICHLEYCSKRGSSIDPHIDDRWIWGNRLVTLNLLSTTVLTLTKPAKTSDLQIRIICKPRSLLVLSDEARYDYDHSIHRADISSRRIAVTFRELPYEFEDFGFNEKLIAEEFRCRAKQRIDLRNKKTANH